MMNQNKIRSFIALGVPDDFKQWIKDIQDQLRDIPGARVTWAGSKGIHLTLKFLGDVEPDLASKIEKELTFIATETAPFMLKSTRTGGFPNLRNPRVLWIGLEGEGILFKLQKNLEKKLSEFGFETEKRRFNPHLTVGRVRHIDGGCPLPAKFENIVVPEFSWKAERLLLMSSLLKPSGAEYKVIADMPFYKPSIYVEE